MKRVFLTLSIVSVLVLSSCKEKASSKIEASNVEVAAERDAAAKSLPVMEFDKVEHDFGSIDQNAPQETIFTFTNTGDAPLIITDAKSSCGQNQVTKTITVTANTSKGTETLRIKAFVTPKGAGPVGPVK